MEKYKWTPEADQVVRQMLDDGCSAVDVCDKLGITDQQLKNRVYALRKKDKTFPNVSFRIKEDPVPDPEACADRQELKPKGELNPLEQEMARMIEERERMLVHKEEKICKMQEIIEELESLVDGLKEKIAKKDRIIAGMAEELYG